jgi:hypothetical protein
MDFSSMSKRFYKSIRHCIPDAILGEGDIPQLRRMSEQIALSVAIQSHSFESLQVRVLKDKDHVMDGGIAESYYLGSSRGWQ